MAKKKQEHNTQDEKTENFTNTIELKLTDRLQGQIKKSRLHMSNFCVVLAGHDMVTNTCRATSGRCKFSVPSLLETVKEIKDLLF